ncbi:unnamed protein product (macronuclear) [Paramecium tetraurelia]|uniref:Uncharacterized protein n=1 Tax=Paramecium tetraurelia TaxID=5888 RepID=A0BQ79_PARTE|nr:uncharacterized protein GSPATT00005447001 [Paramecium tetraurelia]CAK60696.1 unnamed protein product [Paramecium tetraurelia]|eukprot:XP_001428094.1 hypothetical protein (macronuclear) [Paramecium tetraurelia strain d4-2]
MSETISIKLLVVGDGSVGKTCILLSYTTDKFPTEYVPTVFENYQTKVRVDEREVDLSLWDTAGQEGYNNVRQLSYDNTDVFLIVYSVVESNSFSNALHKWHPELNKDKFEQIPKIFVGNKIDMRNEGNSNHVKKTAAEQLIKNLKCNLFEVSALTQEGLRPLFDTAIQIALKKKLNAINDAQKPSQPANDSQCCQLI